jgi:tetratricopeptide (TPR) repeat protein
VSFRATSLVCVAVVSICVSAAPALAQVASPASCKALIDWILILEREMAPTNLRTMMVDRVGVHATNLFRDEHFRPMFGKRISETTFPEMQAFFMNMFPNCGSHLTGNDLAKYMLMNSLVYQPFRAQNGPFSFTEVVAGVAEREKLVASMRAVPVSQTAATPQAFDEIQRLMARAKEDAQKLWPREQKGFMDTLVARQRDVARAIVQSAAAGAPQHATKGLAGANAIAAIRAGHQRYLEVLDADARAQFDRQLDESIAAALRPVAALEKPKLAGMPAGLDGALAIVAWRTALDSQLSGLPQPAEVSALMTESRTLQQQRLAAGAAEFTQIVAQHPKPVRNGMNAAQLLERLFADPQSRFLPEYAQYQAVLTTHTQGQARAAAASAVAAEAANAAAAAAARVPGERCDAAAAHPEDTGHSGDGIADERIQFATAITLCTAAVNASPGTGRFHFQLGRAYWTGKRYDDALQAFLKAEELNHAPAYFYLGQAFEMGLIQGERADSAAAREMYMIAASEGFPPAIRAFGGAAAETAPGTVADFGGFERQNFLRAIYQNTFGDLEAIWKRDTNEEGPWELVFYFQGIHDFLVLRPNEYDATCQGVMEPEVSSALRNMVSSLKEPRVSGRGLDALLSVGMRNERMQSTREAGTDDIYALTADYGGCRGPVVRRVYGNLKGYLLKKSSVAR